MVITKTSSYCLKLHSDILIINERNSKRTRRKYL